MLNDDLFNKLNKMNAFAEKLSRIDSAANKFNLINSAISKFDKNTSLINAHQIPEILSNSAAMKAMSINNYAVEAVRIAQITNPFRDTPLFAMSQMAEKNNALMGALSIPETAKISAGIIANMDAYNKFLAMTSGVARKLSPINNAADQISKLLEATNFIEKNNLNAFDALSGKSFLEILKIYEEREDIIEEDLNEAESLLANDKNLQDELVKAHAAITELQKSKHEDTKQEWLKLIGIKEVLELFMNKVLIDKLDYKPTIASIMTHAVYFGIIVATWIATKKAEELFNSDDKPMHEINININVYNNQPPVSNELKDITINKTPVYLRKSSSTKLLGTIEIYSNVKILKVDSAWCLVEAVAKVKKANTNSNRKKFCNKNSVILIDQVIRGWVQKKNLDLFQ